MDETTLTPLFRKSDGLGTKLCKIWIAKIGPNALFAFIRIVVFPSRFALEATHDAFSKEKINSLYNGILISILVLVNLDLLLYTDQ